MLGLIVAVDHRCRYDVRVLRVFRTYCYSLAFEVNAVGVGYVVRLTVGFSIYVDGIAILRRIDCFLNGSYSSGTIKLLGV